MSQYICFHSEFFFSLWKSKDWLTCYLFLQFLKCFLLFFSLFPLFLAFEFIEWFYCMTEVLDKLSLEIYKSSTSFILVGIFHSLTVLTLSASICTCTLPTTTPKIGISSMLKSHFDCLKQRLCFSAILRNQVVLSSSSFIFFANIIKLSM